MKMERNKQTRKNDVYINVFDGRKQCTYKAHAVKCWD